MIEKRLEHGFSKHLKAEFNVYNKSVAERLVIALKDSSITEYTTSLPDIDDKYCWAEEEGFFIDLMSPEEYAIVTSEEDAITQGMVKHA